jgi:hypothetical protein
MDTKISKLSELTSLISTKEKIDGGVLGFSKRFKLGALLKPYSSVKSQGFNLFSILTALLIARLGGLSVYAMQKTGQFSMDDNTLYRMMNNPLINWRSILLSFVKQFLQCVINHGDNDDKSIKCFVVDDTALSKTGATIEGISRVFNHVIHRYHLGFKMLTLALWDGKSLLPCDCSLHRENKKNRYGLTAKEIKKQFHRKRPEHSCGRERFDELDMEKPSMALSMLKRAVKRGIYASYVLMDSWFVTDEMLKGIRKIRHGMLHVTGICKMDKRKFTVNGKEYNSHTIIKMNETRQTSVHTSRKFHSTYISVSAEYKDTPVKLFYIKYKNAKSWTLLLTTDLSLSFVKTMELYQIRWSIEVMFKECKQYLRLGKAQNTDFYGQIADVSLTLITYLILTLQKRFQSYETMGEIFRHTQTEMLERTLCERILDVFVKIVELLLEILSIDVDEAVRKIMTDDNAADRILCLLNAVNLLNTNDDHVKMAYR